MLIRYCYCYRPHRGWSIKPADKFVYANLAIEDKGFALRDVAATQHNAQHNLAPVIILLKIHLFRCQDVWRWLRRWRQAFWSEAQRPFWQRPSQGLSVVGLFTQTFKKLQFQQQHLWQNCCYNFKGSQKPSVAKLATTLRTMLKDLKNLLNL